MGISLMTEASLDDEGCQAILSVSSHVMEAPLRMLKRHHQVMERSPKRFKNGTIKAQRGVWDIEANEESDRQHGKQEPAIQGGRELGGQEGVHDQQERAGWGQERARGPE